MPETYHQQAISVSLYYDLKDGRSLSRSYLIPTEFFEKSAALKQVYESRESRSALDILRQADPAGFSGEIRFNGPDGAGSLTGDPYAGTKPAAIHENGYDVYYDIFYDVALLPAARREEVRDAILADIAEISFEDVLEAGKGDHVWNASVSLSWKEPRLPEAEGYGRTVDNTFMGHLWTNNYYDDDGSFRYLDCHYSVDLFSGLFPKTEDVILKIAGEATPVTVAY